jgi:hypothetical protein
LVSTAAEDLIAADGSGRTPREGAGSTATVAADSPRPARICASRPPKEWPMMAGLVSSFLDDLLLVGGDVADALAGENAGIFPGQFDGGRIVGPARSDRAVAGLLEERDPVVPAAVQQPQPVHEHDGLPA